MKRIDKIASTIAEEYNYDGHTDTLMRLIKNYHNCKVCAYSLNEPIAYTDSKTGKIKDTRCMLVIKYNNDDYSKSCDNGVEEYMNEEQIDV